jgi:hypothetical protein
MSDWKVEMANDSMAEFFVEFAGPKDSAWRSGAAAWPGSRLALLGCRGPAARRAPAGRGRVRAAPRERAA